MVSNLGKAVGTLGVLVGFATLLGYLGGTIGAGFQAIGLGIGAVLTNLSFLLAFGVGAVAIFVYSKGRNAPTLTRKQLPTLAIIGLSIIFLQFGTKLSIFSISGLDMLSTVNLPIALESAVVGFFGGLAAYYHAKIRKLF